MTQRNNRPPEIRLEELAEGNVGALRTTLDEPLVEIEVRNDNLE